MTESQSRGMPLHTKILLGLLLGAVCGTAVNAAYETPPDWVDWLLRNVMRPAGQLFLNLLFMTVIPLVFASLAVGVAKLGNLSHLGRVGAKTFGFFLLSMALAVMIGLFLVNLIRPGEGIPDETRQQMMEQFLGEAQSKPPAEFGVETFIRIVPRNPLEAAVQMDMLGVIFFALMVGIGITAIPPERGQLLLQTLEGLADVMVYIINLAMKLAPYGVFALIFNVTATLGFQFIQQLGLYVAVVLTGLSLQLFGTLSVLVWLLGGLSPLVFFARVRNVIVTAFSTSSSSATLPTSIKTAEQELGVPPQVAGFVLPLGATMNMNGTALFEGVTAVFLAQVFGVDLPISKQLLVIVLSVLTAVGAAGVPGGSIPLLAMVVSSVGVPAESIALILGVDRLLDMCRTTLNVTGDLAATTFVARSEGFEILKRPPSAPDQFGEAVEGKSVVIPEKSTDQEA